MYVTGIERVSYPHCKKAMLSAYSFREETIKWQCKLCITSLLLS